jgi:hypothetical protein
MVRTIPTFRMLIQQLEVQWGPYRRALRIEDREAFDAVMDLARRHASASSFMVDADPMDALFMSILVEQQKELLELRRKGP